MTHQHSPNVYLALCTVGSVRFDTPLFSLVAEVTPTHIEVSRFRTTQNVNINAAGLYLEAMKDTITEAAVQCGREVVYHIGYVALTFGRVGSPYAERNNNND